MRSFDELLVHLVEQFVVAPSVETAPHRRYDTGGKSLGNIRHWHPVVVMSRIALNTSCRPIVRGLPVALHRGIEGSISAQSASVKSLAYSPPVQECWRRVSWVQAIMISVQLHNRTESQPIELTQRVSNQSLGGSASEDGKA
jgi:hypothetical protein